MADNTGNTKAKRLSKGQRIHARRLKQAARKGALVVGGNVEPGRTKP